MENFEHKNQEDTSTFEAITAACAYDPQNPDQAVNRLVAAAQLVNKAERAAFEKALLASRHSAQYFSKDPGFSGIREEIAAVEVRNGVVRFADKNGVFRLGGFSLSEGSDQNKDINKTTTIDNAALAQSEREERALSKKYLSSLRDEVISTTISSGNFQKMDDGSFQIGSRTKKMRIEPTGADFYTMTHADHIRLIETAAASGKSMEKTATWNPQKNVYVDTETGKTVFLRHGYHYELFVDQEAAAAPAQKKSEELLGSPEFLDRAPRFRDLYVQFIEQVFNTQAAATLDTTHFGEPSLPSMELPGNIVLQALSARSLRMTIPRKGVYTLTSNGDALQIEKNKVKDGVTSQVIYQYDAATHKGQGSRAFTDFADAIGVPLRRAIQNTKERETDEDSWNDSRSIRVVS